MERSNRNKQARGKQAGNRKETGFFGKTEIKDDPGGEGKSAPKQFLFDKRLLTEIERTVRLPVRIMANPARPQDLRQEPSRHQLQMAERNYFGRAKGVFRPVSSLVILRRRIFLSVQAPPLGKRPGKSEFSHPFTRGLFCLPWTYAKTRHNQA